MKRIAIIGAGCSGLTAIKCCLEENLEPVCLEQETDIGGLWNFSRNLTERKGSVYNSCVINTSKEMMSYSDFPVPKHFPVFMPRRYVLEYFRLYAANFDLLPYIRFQTKVISITQSPDYMETGAWIVAYNNFGKTNEVLQERFDGVMVCTGHHAYPYLPKFTDHHLFQGPIIHSHDYRDPIPYAGKRVLIIGIGNSAVDIAVDLSNIASQVYISTRRGAWVIGRKGPFGIPADALANSRIMFTMPRSTMEWMVEWMAKLRFDHKAYGLQPNHRGLQTHPTIHDDLPTQIMTEKVLIRPNVLHFCEQGVMFSDHSYLEVDAIILATGYNYQYPFLDKSILDTRDNKSSLYKYVFPPQLRHPTLGVIGLIQAIGAVMPIAEMQSRWYTHVMAGHACLPSEEVMVDDIRKKSDENSRQYVTSRRHKLQAFFIEYMDDVATLIGIKPNFLHLALKDPILMLKCILGPCIAAQYRLTGPGRWSGASGVINRVIEDMTTGTKSQNETVLATKSLSQTCDNAENWPYLIIVLAIVLLWFIIGVFV